MSVFVFLIFTVCFHIFLMHLHLPSTPSSQVNMMAELPSNVFLAEEFLEYFAPWQHQKKTVWDLIPAAFWGEKLELFRVKGIVVFWKMISWSDPCQKTVNLDRKQESASRNERGCCPRKMCTDRKMNLWCFFRVTLLWSLDADWRVFCFLFGVRRLNHWTTKIHPQIFGDSSCKQSKSFWKELDHSVCHYLKSLGVTQFLYP